MAANIPDMGAVAHLGGQFQHNVFHTIEKKAQRATRKLTTAQGIRARREQAAQQQQAKTMQQQRNYAHGEALKFQAAQFKVKQQQINYAHGQALQEAKQRAKGGPVSTAPTSKAPSLTPSFSSAPTTHTSPVKPQGIPATSFSSQFTPQKSPSKPQGIAATTFSSQRHPQKPLQQTRGNVVASSSSGPTPNMPSSSMERSGSVTGPQFPQHTHPEGSSTAPLPHLTASQPKPNQFTVGSRNVKPLGIAAKGSQLEAWAMQRQADVRKQRGSDNTQLRLGD